MMPWAVKRDSRCPVGKPFAVVKEADGELVGCHVSRGDARAQQVALYAREAVKSVGFVPQGLKDFNPREARDEHGRWTRAPGHQFSIADEQLRQQQAASHGGFKVGDQITFTDPYGGVQKRSGTVAALQRNGYLRVRTQPHGTFVSVHHRHAKRAEAKVPWSWKDDETRFAVQEEAPPNADRWANGLTDEQRTALENYSTGGYQRLNPKLRGEGGALTPDEQKQVDEIRTAIKDAGEYPADKRPTVWRGLRIGPDPGSYFTPYGSILVTPVEEQIARWASEAFKPGQDVQFGGFQSTSFSPLPGLNAAQSRQAPGVMFEIRAKGGAPLWKAGGHFDDEYELLLSDQTHYKVVKVLPSVPFEANDYGDTVQMTVVQLEQL